MDGLLTREMCVDLRDLPRDIYEELISESYTVVRTGGWEQSDWRIPTGAHDCDFGCTGVWKIGALATNRIQTDYAIGPPGSGPWRIYMVFDGEPTIDPQKEHVCGWRPCSPERRGFWPTRLSDDAEKEGWWLRLDGLLNSL